MPTKRFVLTVVWVVALVYLVQCATLFVYAATTIYDFNSDTVGQAPANTTTTVGAFQVANQATLGNSLHATSETNNTAGIIFNNFATSTDSSVTWKEVYVSNGGSSGFTLRAQPGDTTFPGIRSGYFFQVNNSGGKANKVLLWRFDPGSFNNVLATWDLTASSTRWFRALAIGSSLGFYYSNDGTNFILLGSSTDSTYSSGIVQYNAGFGVTLGNDYIDDITYSPVTDTTPPNISAIASSTSSRTAIITWTTDEPADSQINYGLTSGYTATSSLVSSLTTTHSITLFSLNANTTYHFRVRSSDAAGNLATSGDFTFTTASSSAIVPTPTFLLKFDGNYTDSSGNGNNGTNDGGSITTDGTRGQVLSVTGANDVGVGTALPSNFTKAAWVYLNTSAAGKYNILSCGPGTNTNQDFFWVSNDAGGGAPSTMTLRAGSFVSGSVNNYVWDSTLFPSATWVHVAVTFNSAAKLYSLYKNGVLIATSTAANAPVNTAGETIGNCTPSNAATGWNGYIDNAELWNSVLTSSQVSALYAGDDGVAPTAPSAPTDVRTTSTEGVSSIDLSWTAPDANDSPITDYLIEYKLSSDPTWTTFTDGISSATTATVTGLTIGSAYDFRISAVNSVGTSSSSATATATPGQAMTDYYILSAGQSLSTGFHASPALSITQPYNNLMFASGVEDTGTPLIALTESGQGENGDVETPSSGMANSLSGYTSSAHPFIVGLHGHDGTDYAGLKRGTTYYSRGITQVTDAKNYLDTLSTALDPIAITLVHGETDYQEGNATTTYEADLHQWQQDYQSDVNAITGATSTLPMFVSQMNSGWTGELAVAQLQAHEDYPGQIILIGPKYQYGYNTDNLHLINTESKELGEMFAKVINKVVFQHETWNPLMPTGVTMNGNTVLISYDIPVGTLAIDTTNVAARQNDGFEFTQTGGNAVSINSVQLINGDTQVKLTLSAVPTGTDPHIRYAWSCPSGATTWCGDGANSNFVGGNIRDTDNSVSPSIDGTGLPLYDWGVTFDSAITVDNFAPVISSISTTTTSSSATVSWNTNKNASARLWLGLTSAYSTSTAEANTLYIASPHTATLNNLAVCTKYHYAVTSSDELGNQATSSDDTLTTGGCTGSASIDSTVSNTITTTSGGTLAQGTLTLSVPASFTTTSPSAVFQASELDGPTFFAAAGAPTSKLRVGNTVFHLVALTDATTTLTTFSQPVSVTLSYNPWDVSGLDTTSLAIYRYDNSSWTALSNCSIDTNTHTVTCDTTNFSDFAIFGSSSINSQVISNSNGSSSSSNSGTFVGCTDPEALNYFHYTFGTPYHVCQYASQASVAYNISTYTFFRDLTVNDSGKDVTELQQFLITNGYPITSGTTGYFGSQTQAALAAYQKIHKLNPSIGYFGPLTRGSIMADIQHTTPKMQTSTSTSSYQFAHDLRLNDTGEDVRQLQVYLNSHGFTLAHTGPGSPGKETDRFGAATYRALIQFQNAHMDDILTPAGLAHGTGYFGKDTRDYINNY